MQAAVTVHRPPRLRRNGPFFCCVWFAAYDILQNAIIAFIAISRNSNQTYIRICLAALASNSDLKLSVWRPFSVGLSISFLLFRAYLLSFYVLAFHPSKQDAWIIPNVFFSETFSKPTVVLSIYRLLPLPPSRDPAEISRLRTPTISFALEDIALHCLMAF